jgi:hypothetical protein
VADDQLTHATRISYVKLRARGKQRTGIRSAIGDRRLRRRSGDAGLVTLRAESGHAVVVVEGNYPDLFRTQPGRSSWLADMLGRLAVRYSEVPIIFAGSRKFAEEWAYRFLGAAVGDAGAATEPSSGSDDAARSDY